MTFPPSLSHTAMADPLQQRASHSAIETGDNNLEECFNGFLRLRVPTPQAYANARHQAEDVVFALRRALYPIRVASSVSGDFLVIGSVGKRTALAPIEAVDVLYLLPTKLQIGHSRDAQTAILAAVSDQYQPAEISTDHLGVLVSSQALNVRVIPAIETRQGYRIPGPVTIAQRTGWQVSNPVSEAATLRLSDSLNNGATRRLLTLLKAWKQASEVEISSFALEVLAQDYFATQLRQQTLAADFKMFTAWARSRSLSAVKAPGSVGSLQIDQAWQGKAKAAYWRATLAEQSVAEEVQKAALEWRHLLGMQFPVPECAAPSVLPILEACA